MAALPYIQLYVADYLADTAHLTAAQHGAYLLLIFNYWQRGQALNNANDRLANVARMSNEEWQINKPALVEYFEIDGDKWFHARIETDLAAVSSKSTKAAEAGKLSGATRRAKAERKANERSTNVERKPNHTDTDTDTDKSKEQKGGKPPSLTLPDWLPESTWADWHAFRNQRKGWTHKARELSLSTLTKLRTRGHDPTAVIEQSIERGWTGLFEPKTEDRSNAISTPSRKLSAVEQVEQAIRERRARKPDDEEPAFAQIGHG